MALVSEIAERYLRPFRVPGVPRAWLSALPARLPVGANPLALVLLGRHAGGSVRAGAVMASIFVAANAVGALVQGRYIDAYGAARILPGVGLLHASALLAIVGLVHGSVPGPALACAAVGGFTLPQASAAVRAMWAQVLRDGPAQRTAFAFETVAIEAVSVLGPLLVTVAVLADYRLPVAASAVLALVGTLGFATSPVARGMRSRGRTRRTQRFVLRTPALMTIAIIVCVGLMVGGLEVSFVAYAVGRGSAATAGIYVACFAIGSVSGGLAFGALRLQGSPDAHRCVLLAADAVLLAVSAAPSPPPVHGALAFVIGTTAAPLYTLLSLHLTSLAGDATAEAYALFVTAALGGSAGGTALTGVLVGHADARPGFILAAAIMLTATVLAALPVLFGQITRTPPAAAEATAAKEKG